MKDLVCAFGVAENGRKEIVENSSVMLKRTPSVKDRQELNFLKIHVHLQRNNVQFV